MNADGKDPSDELSVHRKYPHNFPVCPQSESVMVYSDKMLLQLPDNN